MGKRAKRRHRMLEQPGSSSTEKNLGVTRKPHTEVHDCFAPDWPCWLCEEIGHGQFSDFCQTWHGQQQCYTGHTVASFEANTFDFPRERFANQNEHEHFEDLYGNMDREASCELMNNEPPLQKRYNKQDSSTDAMSRDSKKRKVDYFERCLRLESPFDSSKTETNKLKRRIDQLSMDNQALKKKFTALNTRQRKENEMLRRLSNEGNQTNKILRREIMGLRKHLDGERNNNKKLREENQSLRLQQNNERKPYADECINTDIPLDDLRAAKSRNDELESELAEEKKIVKKYQEKLNMYRNSSLNKTLDKLKAEAEQVQAENKANKDVITKLKSQQLELLAYYQIRCLHTDKAVTTIEHLTAFNPET